jgi:hypothetical protein
MGWNQLAGFSSFSGYRHGSISRLLGTVMRKDRTTGHAPSGCCPKGMSRVADLHGIWTSIPYTGNVTVTIHLFAFQTMEKNIIRHKLQLMQYISHTYNEVCATSGR